MLYTSGVPTAYTGHAVATARPTVAVRGDPLGRNCMDLTEIAVEGYEKVIRCHDAHSGLNAIISIHNTAHGPAELVQHQLDFLAPSPGGRGERREPSIIGGEVECH